jgi:hypothetical protein
MADYVYAPKRDTNHAAIVGVYRALFCSVLDLHKLGGGAPDALIGCAGIDSMIEIKPEGEEPRALQKDFHRYWRGRKILVISTMQQAVDHVAEIRAEIRRRQGGVK